jgi:hypothetical protein
MEMLLLGDGNSKRLSVLGRQMRGGALVFILFCDLVVEILNCHHYRPIRDFLIFPAM